MWLLLDPKSVWGDTEYERARCPEPLVHITLDCYFQGWITQMSSQTAATLTPCSDRLLGGFTCGARKFWALWGVSGPGSSPRLTSCWTGYCHCACATGFLRQPILVWHIFTPVHFLQTLSHLQTMVIQPLPGHRWHSHAGLVLEYSCATWTHRQ